MKVSDILRVKGGTLYTASPDDSLQQAVETMSHFDIGSLAVMEHGDLVGMMTFREVIHHAGQKRRCIGPKHRAQGHGRPPHELHPRDRTGSGAHMMLERHCRYMPVMDNRMLMGVISFYDVAKAVVDAQNFENKCSRPISATGPMKRSKPEAAQDTQ